jgi:hypothetical protein
MSSNEHLDKYEETKAAAKLNNEHIMAHCVIAIRDDDPLPLYGADFGSDVNVQKRLLRVVESCRDTLKAHIVSSVKQNEANARTQSFYETYRIEVIDENVDRWRIIYLATGQTVREDHKENIRAHVKLKYEVLVPTEL